MDKGKVLIIEDEVELAEQVGDYLELKGYRPVYARTATEATLKASNEKFLCILTDINLEKGTGDTVILKIKNSLHHINFHTPIIVLSSVLNKDLLDGIKEHIHWAYVKPYSLERLEQVINDIYRNSL